MNKKTRGVCFTINNYDDNDIAEFMSLFEDDTLCTYIIVGFEKAPRTGTLHMQCYAYYPNTIRLSTFQTKFTKKIHVEAQKAKKNNQAYVYCMKTGDYYEQGQRPRQGFRSDLEEIKMDLKAGTSMIDVADRYYGHWVQYRRSFDEYVRMTNRYKTQLYVYDTRDKHLLYAQNITPEDKVFISADYDTDLADHIYCSGRYKRVFIPHTNHYMSEFGKYSCIYIGIHAQIDIQESQISETQKITECESD